MGQIFQKYCEFKIKHPKALFLLRVGDFYETYEEDAERASKILGITLAKRIGKPSKIAGFPFHALDKYIIKLIENTETNGGQYGYNEVATCDQFKDEITSFKIRNGEMTWEKKEKDSVTPKEAMDSHRDFWVKRYQGNGYYPITHFVWHEEYQQYDTRWKKLRPYEPESRTPKEQYDCWLYILENNPCIISFDEMRNTRQYNNK